MKLLCCLVTIPTQILLIPSTAQRHHLSPVVVKPITPDLFPILEFILPNTRKSQHTSRPEIIQTKQLTKRWDITFER